RLFGDASIVKIFHFARFDLAVLYQAFGIMPTPVYCTKIASRLTRTYTDKHGLKDLARDVLGIDLSKQQQLSAWGAEKLHDAQVPWPVSEVVHRHPQKNKLEPLGAGGGRGERAAACFKFLPAGARLDLAGWATEDIFAHS